jgi:predicted ATPase/class 3 adenylate cyclase
MAGPPLTGQSPDAAGLPPDDDRLVSDATVSGRGARTTTFLFTDLEGSTEQWERAPALMAQALAAHDALVRAVVEEHGGEVFSASGDGFAASFAAAPDALVAAVDIQRRLARTGAEGVELRMRIGLHTGAAQARSGNYFGRAVNRAARIMAAGNGGQIVLSSVTAELVADDPAYRLVPLGSHRLPGLADPVALVGVATLDLPWIDRPVRAGGGKPDGGHGRGALTVDDRGVRATLRGTTGTPLTTFVGRDAELREVTRLLGGHRLVTLVGAGGCGKTRLALIAARALATATPGGAVFVDLAPVADGPAVPAAVAAALDLSVGDDRAVDDLCDQLAGVAALLVLDNCEHVIDHVATLVEQLLARDGALRILATSREPLRVPAEMVWPVPPLAVPDLTDGPDAVRAAEAVRLFVDRAGAGTGWGVQATPAGPGELAAVARICRRLDGLPLAIELAAALVSSLPVADIADRLDHRFELLTAGARSVPRHRTLAAAIQWSVDLLSDEERALFSALGVFVGPFPLGAVEAVLDDRSGHSAALLAELVAKSMVTVVRVGHGARTSYRLLESLRAYALEQLQRRPDAAELRRRHADFYAACAEEAERHVHGRDAGEWLGRVLDELPNMREALATSFSSGDLRTGLRLAGSLGWYFGRLGRIGEAAEWLDLALDADDELSPQLQLLARRAAGTIAFTRGDYTRTSQLGQEGIALARQLGDRRELAIMLIVRGGAAVYEGAFDQAQACFTEAEALCRDLGDRWGRAWLLTLWSVVYRHQGDLRTAGEQLTEALATFQAVGDEHGQILPLVNLSINALLDGNPDEAAIQAQSALDLARQLGDRQYEHVARTARGRIGLYRGDLDGARRLLLSSLGDFPGYEHWLIVAWATSALAQIAARRDHHEEACVLEGYSDRVRAEHGIAPAWHAALDLPDWFGAEQAEAARARGAELTLPEVVSCAAAATAAAGLIMEETG